MTTSIARSDPDPGAVVRRQPSTGHRRAGYLIAALVNLGGLWFVHHLLAWGWPPVLTDAFADLLPYITASFVATVTMNLVWVVHDPAWLRHLGQIGLNLVAIVAAVRTWTIFPFALTGYGAAGELVVRTLILVGLLGLMAATIAELVRFVQVIDR
jgi:hypothetical protein